MIIGYSIQLFGTKKNWKHRLELFGLRVRDCTLERHCRPDGSSCDVLRGDGQRISPDAFMSIAGVDTTGNTSSNRPCSEDIAHAGQSDPTIPHFIIIGGTRGQSDA